jgi:hypothetical protein
MARLVRATYRGSVRGAVARTRRAMTLIEWRYVAVNGGWYHNPNRSVTNATPRLYPVAKVSVGMPDPCRPV